MKANSLTPRLRDALAMATRVHADMKRKVDGQPYIVHPLAVFKWLQERDADEDTQIAGLLHDVLEDAPSEKRETYRKEIEETFGSGVLALVESVTEEDKSLSWRERKERYLERLKGAERPSLLIACADLIHNTQSLQTSLATEGEAVWSKLNAPKQQQLWVIVQTMELLTEKLGGRYTLPLRPCIPAISMHPPRTECLWFNYDDPWDGTEVTCPVCEWKGVVRDGDMSTYDTLLDFSCPVCEEILVIVRFPNREV